MRWLLALKRLVPRSLLPSAILRRAILRRTRGLVAGGPFRGMRYIDRSVWGAYLPKLLGTYELELHPALERAITEAPRHIVDVGGAEGYYAVGLLRRLPGATLTVFEALEQGRQAIAELAQLNGVADRLQIRASCTPELLSDCLAQNDTAFLVCDVEGYEIELIDPSAIPELASATLLIEVHDDRVPHCAAQLTARLEATHHVKQLPQRPRRAADYPLRGLLLPRLSPILLRYVLNEFRTPNTGWLVALPRT